MTKIDTRKEADLLKKEWKSPRFEGVTRPYSAEDVIRLRGSVKIEYTLARNAAEKLWKYLHEENAYFYKQQVAACRSRDYVCINITRLY